MQRLAVTMDSQWFRKAYKQSKVTPIPSLDIQALQMNGKQQGKKISSPPLGFSVPKHFCKMTSSKALNTLN